MLVSGGNPVEESQDVFGMVFLQAIFLKHADCLKWAQRRAVRTCSSSSIVNIRDSNDSCKIVKRIPRNLLGVTRAVTALMVLQGSFFNAFVNGLLFQKLVAEQRMLLYQRKFFICIFIGFIQNLIRNRNFTNIME